MVFRDTAQVISKRQTAIHYPGDVPGDDKARMIALPSAMKRTLRVIDEA